MRVQNTVFVSLTTFFLLTAASFAQQVKTDYDHSANFGQYKTYSWVSPAAPKPAMMGPATDAGVDT